MIAWRVLLALCLLVPLVAESAVYITPPGVTCANDTRLAAPVTAQDFCFESTSNTLNNWNGAAWVAITTGASQQSTNNLAGLKLSNNGADPVNDLDIALGLADSDDATISSRQQMSLVSALTKQLDVAWAVGTNQGMRSSAGLADGTWHIFLIKRTDTGVVDIFADTTVSPTLPTNYTKKRRIGSIIRLAGTIKPFSQDGDLFQWINPVLDVDHTNPGTSAVTRTLTVPTGISVLARMNLLVERTAGEERVYLSDLATTDLAPSITVVPLASSASGGADSRSLTLLEVRTNISGQIRSRNDVSGAGSFLRIATLGWWDRRGRDN